MRNNTPAMTTHPFERIGHRGLPREVPENTLDGFLSALDHGADAVELDVHATRDGVVVVHHDFDVGGIAIADSAWSELRRARPARGGRIPSLDDVLRAIGDRATVYVELKGRGIETRVAEVTRESGKRYAFHSFDHEAIRRCAATLPDVPRGVLIDRNEPQPLDVLRRAVRESAPRDVWPHFTLVDERFMDEARAHGLRVICWTVNSAEEAARLLALGVVGLCTDDVRMLAHLT